MTKPRSHKQFKILPFEKGCTKHEEDALLKEAIRNKEADKLIIQDQEWQNLTDWIGNCQKPFGVIYGKKGCGKTTLLHWIQQRNIEQTLFISTKSTAKEQFKKVYHKRKKVDGRELWLLACMLHWQTNMNENTNTIMLKNADDYTREDLIELVQKQLNFLGEQQPTRRLILIDEPKELADKEYLVSLLKILPELDISVGSIRFLFATSQVDGLHQYFEDKQLYSYEITWLELDVISQLILQRLRYASNNQFAYIQDVPDYKAMLKHPKYPAWREGEKSIISNFIDEYVGYYDLQGIMFDFYELFDWLNPKPRNSMGRSKL